MTVDVARNSGGYLALAVLALLSGAATGLVAALFRLTLGMAERLRDVAAATAGGSLPGLAALVPVCGAGAAFACWLVVRFAQQASGSGIPHVEAVIEGLLPPATWRILPIKFVGGLVAIGSGLALGREGPSVQMGATVADQIALLLRRPFAERSVLMAACAGAGLATAFNAPIAGAVFVLEELVRRFETRTAIAALGASAAAISVSHLILGSAPDFHLTVAASEGLLAKPVYLLLGVVAGFAAILYNRGLLATLTLCARLPLGPVWRAGLIGGAVGALAWGAPDLVGGGDPLTQRALDGVGTPGAIAGLLVIRFALSLLSYAAGTPGGLFAPMLTLGAQLGLLCGLLATQLLPQAGLDPAAFAVVGMAAFFTGAVRAPVTGVVIVTEMTGSVAMLLPMLIAAFGAMIVTTAAGTLPIYDSLRERLLSSQRPESAR